MTLYRLYTQNDHRAGFWVQHRTWANTCARVQSIAGRRSGRLPGCSPAHDGAEIVVEIYDVRSGRRVDSAAPPRCPSDRNFTQIAEPSWFHQEALHESFTTT